MKLSGVLSVALLASVGSAQTVKSVADKFPSCLRNCFVTYLEKECGSGSNGLKCACNKQEQLSDEQQVIQSTPQCNNVAFNCDVSDIKSLVKTVKSICSDVNAAPSLGMMHPAIGAAVGVGALAVPFVLA